VKGFVYCPKCNKPCELPLTTPAAGGFFFNMDFEPFKCACGANISCDQMLQYEMLPVAPEISIPDIVEQLDRKTGKGALWEDVVKELKKRGIDEDKAGDLIMEAFDNGRIYEPTIGWLMKV
jgi:hypothetical protein